MDDTVIVEQDLAGTESEQTVGRDGPSSTAADHSQLRTFAGDGSPRRTVKLVLTLRPTGSEGYRALFAMGADGCDPVLRAADVADFAAALDEMSSLFAEVGARWQVQPRYPATSSAPKAKRTAPAGQTIEASQSPPPDEEQGLATDPPDTTTPERSPADTGQLSMFPEHR